MLAHQRAKERRFPASVGPDKAEDVTALNRRAEVLDEGPPFYGELQIAGNGNLIAAPF